MEPAERSDILTDDGADERTSKDEAPATPLEVKALFGKGVSANGRKQMTVRLVYANSKRLSKVFYLKASSPSSAVSSNKLKEYAGGWKLTSSPPSANFQQEPDTGIKIEEQSLAHGSAISAAVEEVSTESAEAVLSTGLVADVRMTSDDTSCPESANAQMDLSSVTAPATTAGEASQVTAEQPTAMIIGTTAPPPTVCSDIVVQGSAVSAFRRRCVTDGDTSQENLSITERMRQMDHLFKRHHHDNHSSSSAQVDSPFGRLTLSPLIAFNDSRQGRPSKSSSPIVKRNRERSSSAMALAEVQNIPIGHDIGSTRSDKRHSSRQSSSGNGPFSYEDGRNPFASFEWNTQDKNHNSGAVDRNDSSSFFFPASQQSSSRQHHQMHSFDANYHPHSFSVVGGDEVDIAENVYDKPTLTHEQQIDSMINNFKVKHSLGDSGRRQFHDFDPFAGEFTSAVDSHRRARTIGNHPTSTQVHVFGRSDNQDRDDTAVVPHPFDTLLNTERWDTEIDENNNQYQQQPSTLHGNEHLYERGEVTSKRRYPFSSDYRHTDRSSSTDLQVGFDFFQPPPMTYAAPLPTFAQHKPIKRMKF